MDGVRYGGGSSAPVTATNPKTGTVVTLYNGGAAPGHDANFTQVLPDGAKPVQVMRLKEGMERFMKRTSTIRRQQVRRSRKLLSCGM
ncbi:MAG TPA: hypothetical protein PLN86_01590 [Candidatus Hydrogenedentes bacterium]|nr:hypothetical protein [Candidatus Hydrogenedentota bacterium]